MEKSKTKTIDIAWKIWIVFSSLLYIYLFWFQEGNLEKILRKIGYG